MVHTKYMNTNKTQQILDNAFLVIAFLAIALIFGSVVVAAWTTL